MYVQEECYACLKGLARRTAELAANNPAQKDQILKESLAYLDRNYSSRQIPTRIAGEIQRLIRTAASKPDPFSLVKQREMNLAGDLARDAEANLGDDLYSRVAFAARGNSIDFFVEVEELRKEQQKPVNFFRNDLDVLQSFLENLRISRERKKILYFADNAGECYFDLPLINKLEEYAEVTYVVKESPVQNDLTLQDLEQSGIREKFKRVISTGSDTPGLDLDLVSGKFCLALASADLLIAKGMGYYETMPQLFSVVPVFLILKAKCGPIARSLGAPINSYIACMSGNMV
jgi:uncharacterized protein with ATP-grasp and redox domains